VEVPSEFDPEEILTRLLATDITLIVLDPIRLLDTPTLSRVVPLLLKRGNVQFVVNGHLPPGATQQRIRDLLRAAIEQHLSALGLQVTHSDIHFVQAESALSSLDALASGLSETSSSSARVQSFDAYQDGFVRSNLGSLQRTLSETTAALPIPQSSTAQHIASLAIEYITSVIENDRKIADSAARTVSDLRHSAEDAASKAKHLSIISMGIQGGVVAEGVDHEAVVVRRELEEKFNGKWSWLALVARLRVDDVGAELATDIERNLAVRLSRQVSCLFSDTGAH
jgi:hypothetical protein